MSHRRAIALRENEPAPQELLAVVAVGCPRFMNAEAAEYIAEFAQSSERHRVGLLFEKTPNRIDWSFSRIIEAFKKTDATWLVWNDADVLPTTTFDQAYSAVERAFSKGFHVLASPCMSAEGSFSLRPIPLDGSSIVDSGPFEVEFITGGHWWMHRKVVDALPVLSQFKNAAGGYENFYMAIPDDTTEDADLCRRIRSLGFRIAALPDLWTDHLKIARLPSYRRGMPKPSIKGQVVPKVAPVAGPSPQLTKLKEDLKGLEARIEA